MITITFFIVYIMIVIVDVQSLYYHSFHYADYFYRTVINHCNYYRPQAKLTNINVKNTTFDDMFRIGFPMGFPHLLVCLPQGTCQYPTSPIVIVLIKMVSNHYPNRQYKQYINIYIYSVYLSTIQTPICHMAHGLYPHLLVCFFLGYNWQYPHSHPLYNYRYMMLYHFHDRIQPHIFR